MIRSVQAENEATIAAMSPEERELEREELLARFGGGLLETFKKRREARELADINPDGPGLSSFSCILWDVPDRRANAGCTDAAEHPPAAPKSDDKSPATQDDAAPAKSGESDADASRVDSHPDFAIVYTVHFDVSQDVVPATLKSKVATFPFFASTPAAPKSTPAIGLVDEEAVILAKSFPDATLSDPAQSWLRPLDPSSESASISTAFLPRYSLSGQVITPEASAVLPTHLGLHHHGDAPSDAGYTLDEVVHLCLSTSVPQRVAMLAVMGAIVRRGGAEDARSKAVVVAARAVADRGGGVGIVVRGVEVLWEVLRTLCPSADDWDLANELSVVARSTDDDILASLDIAVLIPILIDHLSFQSLPARTTHEILSILVLISRLPAPSSSLLLSTTTPSALLPILSRNLLSPSPDLANLVLLKSLVVSSRANALSILTSPKSPLPALLKFIAMIYADSSATDLALARLSIDVFTSLARYGLSASLCSDASDMWRTLGRIVSSLGPDAPEASLRLATSYFDLLAVWTTCAIDPHKTSPEHEITWSQIVGMGWEDEGLCALRCSLAKGEDVTFKQRQSDLLSAVLSFLRAWVAGSRINEPKGGEAFAQVLEAVLSGEQADVLEKISAAAVTRLGQLAQGPGNAKEIGSVAGLLSGLLRLFPSLTLESLSSTKSLATLVDSLAYSSIWTDEAVSSFTHLRPVTDVLVALLSRALVAGMSHRQWLSKALDVLVILLPGDEDLASEIVALLLHLDFATIASELGLSAALVDIGHRHGFSIIDTFFQFIISPREDHQISPLFATSASLPHATTLRLPSPAQPRLPNPPSVHYNSPHGLPLSRSWFLSPITELLHSRSSQAFAAAPPDWDASETELVRATLFFLRLVQKCGSRIRLNASEIILSLMDVFLLEQGVEASSEGDEVFRDPAVERAMRDLLSPFIPSSAANISSPTSPLAFRPSPRTLEEAYALAAPGRRTPFFQPYSDFLGLYTAVSFSHPVFSLLLLPPLAMHYPIDYRKAFWAEENVPLLVGIECETMDVVVEDASLGVRAFFEPREEDSDMLGSYLRALIGGGSGRRLDRARNGFLWELALRHVAGALWVKEEAGGELTNDWKEA